MMPLRILSGGIKRDRFVSSFDGYYQISFFGEPLHKLNNKRGFSSV
jgi:hypothetical protein